MSDLEQDDFNRIDAEDEGDEVDGNRLDTEDRDDVDDDEGETGAPHATAVLEYLVRAVVEDPQSVGVDFDDHGRRPALNVTVAPGDMGRVIGKRGRVATAIRTVTRSAAVRDDIELDIEFLD